VIPSGGGSQRGEIGAGGQDVHSRAIRLARLSVWDTVGGARLGVALTGGAQIDLDQLRDLVAHRSIPNQQ
jgi:hypothetical protein